MKTAKQTLKDRIAYYVGKGEEIALLEPITIQVQRTDGYTGTADFIITELYRNGRGVACVSDGINYRTVHEIEETQCATILNNL